MSVPKFVSLKNLLIAASVFCACLLCAMFLLAGCANSQQNAAGSIAVKGSQASSGVSSTAPTEACESCVYTGANNGSGTLSVGVRTDIVGFSSYNAHTGKYYGFEVDMARELAARLGYAQVKYVPVEPSNRKEVLEAGSVDCLIACYSVSESREKNFNFSSTYYTDSIVFAVEKSSKIENLAGSKNVCIGTLQGANTAAQLATYLYDIGYSNGEKLTSTQDNSQATFDTWNLVQFESYAKLFEALEEGSVDIAACDGSIASAHMNTSRTTLGDVAIKPQEYAVATQKNSSLTASINAQIDAMLDDGTVANLLDKWD